MSPAGVHLARSTMVMGIRGQADRTGVLLTIGHVWSTKKSDWALFIGASSALRSKQN